MIAIMLCLETTNKQNIELGWTSKAARAARGFLLRKLAVANRVEQLFLWRTRKSFAVEKKILSEAKLDHRYR